MEPLIRDGIVLPHKWFCGDCYRRMVVKPARNFTTLMTDEERHALTEAMICQSRQGTPDDERREFYRATVEAHPEFESFGLSYRCPTCTACGTSHEWEYTEEEAMWIAEWHNADDYASVEEERWALLHQPMPGIAARASDALITAFPQLRDYLEIDEAKGRRTFTVPAPVPGRAWPLVIGIENVDDVVCFGPSHTHVAQRLRPGVGENWRAFEARYFALFVEILNRIFADEAVFYAYGHLGAIGRGGGGYFTSPDEENAEKNVQKCLATARRTRWHSPVTVQFYSWMGRHDRTYTLEPEIIQPMRPFAWQQFKESEMPSEAGTVLRRFANGEKMTVARVAFAADSAVPVHAHENEQFTFVLSGTMEFTIGGEPVTVREGEFVHMPPNVPHGARSVGEAVVLDVFTPIRADWKE